MSGMPDTFSGQLTACPSSATHSVPLPLAHVTDFERLRSILRANVINPPGPCKVYGEHIFYTFWARPDYRLQGDGYTYSEMTCAPVCLLLQSDLAQHARRVLPFDSGGFERYGPAMHHSWTREQFELNGGIDLPMLIVGTFFGHNRAYYDRKAVEGLKFNTMQEKLHVYYKLITNQLPSVFDQRCSAIEVQLVPPIELNGNVLAVVLPRDGLDIPMRDAIRNIGAHAIPYEFETPFVPGDFFKSIRDAVRDYLIADNLL